MMNEFGNESWERASRENVSSFTLERNFHREFHELSGKFMIVCLRVFSIGLFEVILYIAIVFSRPMTSVKCAD